MLMEPMTKNAPSNSNKNPRKPPRRKPRFDTQSPGKGGPVTCSKNSIKVKEFFLLNPPAQWVNKRYPLLLANMRYIRDGICTGHIRRRVYFSSVYLQVKKIQSILTKNQSINCLYECRDWTMNGRGGGKCFPPTKETGTRVEDSTTRPNNIRSSGESGFQGTSSKTLAPPNIFNFFETDNKEIFGNQNFSRVGPACQPFSHRLPFRVFNQV